MPLWPICVLRVLMMPAWSSDNVSRSSDRVAGHGLSNTPMSTAHSTVNPFQIHNWSTPTRGARVRFYCSVFQADFLLCRFPLEFLLHFAGPVRIPASPCPFARSHRRGAALCLVFLGGVLFLCTLLPFAWPWTTLSSPHSSCLSPCLTSPPPSPAFVSDGFVFTSTFVARFFCPSQFGHFFLNSPFLVSFVWLVLIKRIDSAYWIDASRHLTILWTITFCSGRVVLLSFRRFLGSTCLSKSNHWWANLRFILHGNVCLHERGR